MPIRPKFTHRRSSRAGLGICLLAAAGAGTFAFGLVHQSYWGLAVPVAFAVAIALTSAFWIGWTILTVASIPEAAEPYRGLGARAGALMLCAVSILLAGAFVWGVFLRSYWALAIPVAVAVFGLLGMVFHIGWSIFWQRNTLPLQAAAREIGQKEGPKGGTESGTGDGDAADSASGATGPNEAGSNKPTTPA